MGHSCHFTAMRMDADDGLQVNLTHRRHLWQSAILAPYLQAPVFLGLSPSWPYAPAEGSHAPQFPHWPDSDQPGQSACPVRNRGSQPAMRMRRIAQAEACDVAQCKRIKLRAVEQLCAGSQEHGRPGTTRLSGRQRRALRTYSDSWINFYHLSLLSSMQCSISCEATQANILCVRHWMREMFHRDLVLYGGEIPEPSSYRSCPPPSLDDMPEFKAFKDLSVPGVARNVCCVLRRRSKSSAVPSRQRILLGRRRAA